MAIAETLTSYLQQRDVEFNLVPHRHTERAKDSARAAHIPAHQVAKAVVLKDSDGFVISVVPANHNLEITWVNAELGRQLELANEQEFRALFADCEPGAVPALGEAYGVQVIWDDDLRYTADVYIEAGDHENLICLDGKDFRKLMASLPHSIISKDRMAERWKY